MDITKIENGNQASVPPDVRAALELRPGDAIVWNIVDGEVKITKADPSDVAFDDVLVPTPEGFAASSGLMDLARLPEGERVRLLKAEVEAGRASGVSRRSLDDILEAHRARRD